LLHPSESSTGFNVRIFACVDSALDTFGAGAKKAFYFQISEKYGIPEKDFPKRPLDVIRYMKEILPRGYPIVERAIVKEICQRFNIPYTETLSLAGVLARAQSKFLSVK